MTVMKQTSSWELYMRLWSARCTPWPVRDSVGLNSLSSLHAQTWQVLLSRVLLAMPNFHATWPLHNLQPPNGGFNSA